MNEKLEKILQEKYPDILCMAFGIECSDTWYQLLDDLMEDLTYVQKTFDVKIKASQIKEKFGTLRFYYDYDLGKSWTVKPRRLATWFHLFMSKIPTKIMRKFKPIEKLFYWSCKLSKYKHLKDGSPYMKDVYRSGWRSTNDGKVLAIDNVRSCIEEYIRIANAMSEKICCHCAVSGTFDNPIIQTSGWISYICNKCDDKNQKERAKKIKEMELKRKSKAVEETKTESKVVLNPNNTYK